MLEVRLLLAVLHPLFFPSRTAKKKSPPKPKKEIPQAARFWGRQGTRPFRAIPLLHETGRDDVCDDGQGDPQRSIYQSSISYITSNRQPFVLLRLVVRRFRVVFDVLAVFVFLLGGCRLSSDLRS